MKKSVLSLIGLFFCVVSAFASNSESKEKSFVVGKVFVNNENTVAPYAKVVLEGADVETLTQSDGSFRLSDVPVGSYRLTVVVFGEDAIDLGVLEVKKDNPSNVKCILIY